MNKVYPHTQKPELKPENRTQYTAISDQIIYCFKDGSIYCGHFDFIKYRWFYQDGSPLRRAAVFTWMYKPKEFEQ